MYIGEAEIPATVTVGQFFVIQTHEMEDGGMQVVDMHFFLDRRKAELVGGAIGHATLHPATRQPDAEAVVVVVASVATLAGGGASELPAP